MDKRILLNMEHLKLLPFGPEEYDICIEKALEIIGSAENINEFIETD